MLGAGVDQDARDKELQEGAAEALLFPKNKKGGAKKQQEKGTKGKKTAEERKAHRREYVRRKVALHRDKVRRGKAFTRDR